MITDGPAGGAPGAEELRTLVFPPTGADGAAIAKLFAAAGITFSLCTSCAELCTEQSTGAAALILSEESLLADPSGLLACIAHQPLWSDLPIIVLSRSGREPARLGQILSLLGNVNVVERPIRTSTLISLVRSTLRARHRQYQVRAYLLQQEQAQKAIRAGERRYRSVIDNVPDYAIFMTDVQGRVTTWNSGAGAILGYSAEEIIGQSVVAFAMQSDGVDTVDQELREAARSGRLAKRGWKSRKDGSKVFLEGVIRAARDDTDNLTGFGYFLRDVTEKHHSELEREQLLESERTARAEAEHASRMKDEFLATLSHELRTPLNAILGWTQVLRVSKDLSEDISKALVVIERNARSQAQIIEDLLDMSAIISGKVRLDVQRLDLVSIVAATIETVKPAAHAKGIRLQVMLDPLAGPVRGDPDRLQQILWNLLSNSIKFTQKGGKVSVTLARVNSHLELEVMDDGEGITATFLPRVFDRFRQADSSSTRRHGGLGLGLSIVKQLVELHGGSISARSGGAGMGSTFRISLPLMASVDDQLEPDPLRQYPRRSLNLPSVDAIATADLSGVTVLLVDDEADARELIQRILQDSSAIVMTAGSVKEALDLMKQRPIDVLISDIGMPVEDGYSLIRRVRAMGEGNAVVPAIALTAYARIEDRVKSIQAGYQLHLSKPVEPIELVAMVQSLARRPMTSSGRRTAD